MKKSTKTQCITCTEAYPILCMACSKEMHENKLVPSIYNGSWRLVRKPTLVPATVKHIDRLLAVVAIPASHPMYVIVKLEGLAKNYTQIEWFGRNHITYAVREYYIKTVSERNFIDAVKAIDGAMYMRSREWLDKIKRNSE